MRHIIYLLFFFFNDTATTEIYTLSLHDALPISPGLVLAQRMAARKEPGPVSSVVVTIRLHVGSLTVMKPVFVMRSEEHTSELQSQSNLVCRLLLEKKKKHTDRENNTIVSDIYTQ